MSAPGGAGAGAAGPGFGPWFRRQRELRGISEFYVAARLKLAPDRIRAIEEGNTLARDGHGRATARALAQSIGADPVEAVAQLAELPAPASRPRSSPLLAAMTRWGRQATAAFLVGVGVWLLAHFFLTDRSREQSPALVYRTDYVQRLLGER